MIYSDWAYWQLYSKVTFDGANKLIIVNPGTTTLNIRVDVYSAWILWLAIDNNSKYLLALRYSGLDPIPGGSTGDTYFLINGWKLQCDFTTIQISGVLFSDNYGTAYYTYANIPQYAAAVSSIVNTVTSLQNIVTGDLSTVSTATQNAAAVWSQVLEGLTAEQMVRIMMSVLSGKVSGAGTGTESFRNIADTADRVVVSTTTAGNRTAVVLNGT